MYLIGFAAAATLLFSATSCNSQSSQVELRNANDTMSWILGENFARGLSESNIQINKDIVLKAVEAILDGKPSMVDDATYKDGMDQFAVALHVAQQNKAKET